jgi:hypothetical protein
VSKVMLAVGVLASLVLLDPMSVMSRLGPHASVVGFKIKSSIDGAVPQVSWFRK